MKKIYLSIIISMFAFFTNAQIGIGTTEPTRTLDINGNMRVTSYLDKTNDENYPNLVASNSDGNIDFIRKQSIPQNPSLQVEAGRVIYITEPTTYLPEYKWATCGDIRVKLNTNSNMTIQGISNFSNTSGVIGIERWGSSGTYGYVGSTLNFDGSTNNLGSIQSGASNVINVVHPITGDLYRITFSVTKNSATTNNYSAVCERFYNGQ